jgi:acetyltransferase (GNAT) family protein
MIHTNSEISSADEISIKPVQTKKDFSLFYKIPSIIYKSDPNWIAPFWTEFKEFFHHKNPFWSHAEKTMFIAYKNQKPIGRIASFIDHLYCQSYHKKIGFFGFFESINNKHVAHLLFQSAQDWLASKDMTLMQGPINGRVDTGCGFLIKANNSPPSLLSTYSPIYYTSFCESFQMRKERDLVEYYVDLRKEFPKIFIEKAKLCLNNGISVRTFNRLRTNKELDWWIDLFLETFKDHWGYIPVSPEEVKTRFGVKQLRWAVDARLFHIAEYKNIPIAYLWSTPEYNQVFRKMNGKLNPYQLLRFLNQKNHIDIGKLHIIGIKKEWRHKHIGTLLNYHSLQEMKKRGYKGAIVGWIDEKNKHAHATISLTGANIIKKYRVYEKKI